MTALAVAQVLKKAVIVRKRKVMEHTLTERSVLEAIRDFPFLVTLHYAFQTDAKLHLIMGEPPSSHRLMPHSTLPPDYICGGEMFTHLYRLGPFSEPHTRLYVSEVALALGHLHSLGIIYRDIKLENLLLDREGHVVLTDFGLSKEMLPEQVKQHWHIQLSDVMEKHVYSTLAQTQ